MEESAFKEVFDKEHAEMVVSAACDALSEELSDLYWATNTWDGPEEGDGTTSRQIIEGSFCAVTFIKN